MNKAIKDKVVVVTGANRGIGAAIVATFLEQGASKIYLAVRDVNSTKELESKFGDRVVTIEADVSNTKSIQALAAKTTDANIVINNAGVGNPQSTIGDTVEEDFKFQLEVNAFGLLRVANAFAKTLEKNKGALVQLNSIASMKNFSHLSTYSASKAASYNLTQGLRSELGPKGVTVISVHPGPVATEMGKNAGFEDGASTNTIAEAIAMGLEKGDFHVFPDEMAKQVGAAYEGFSENVVLADFSE
jgi:NAD(P)-dependent dehydrogenase (short-subunit alcohol dehydrogenase family)